LLLLPAVFCSAPGPAALPGTGGLPVRRDRHPSAGRPPLRVGEGRSVAASRPGRGPV